MLDVDVLKARKALDTAVSYRGNHLMSPLQPSLRQLSESDEAAATCGDVRICGPTVGTLVHHGSGPYMPVLHLNHSTTMQSNFGCLIGHQTSTAGVAFEILDEHTAIVVNPGYKRLPVGLSLAIWTFPGRMRHSERREDADRAPPACSSSSSPCRPPQDRLRKLGYRRSG